MSPMQSLGKFLLLTGALMILLGGLVILAGKAGLPLGRLPGDGACPGGVFPERACCWMGISDLAADRGGNRSPVGPPRCGRCTCRRMRRLPRRMGGAGGGSIPSRRRSSPRSYRFSVNLISSPYSSLSRARRPIFGSTMEWNEYSARLDIPVSKMARW